MTEPIVLSNELSLAFDSGYRAEVTALRAKATFKELLGSAPEYNWRFTAERAVRNTTALYLALRQVAKNPRQIDAASEAARIAAQAWEGLASLEEYTSRGGALINAAVAYELAGYQANAACLARLAAKPEAWQAEPTVEGLAAAFVQRLLLRVLTGAPRIQALPDAIDNEVELGRRMAGAIAVRGLEAASRFLLAGRPAELTRASEMFDLANRGFTAVGDVRGANLSANLNALLPTIGARSTWTTLGDVVPDNLRWQRYLRILARGTGSEVLDSRSISELWPSQIAALRGGLLEQTNSKVVKMPTSAGKTRVAEMAIVHTLVTISNARCIYVAPFRALVNEVEASFATLFADLGYSSSSILGSYEQDVLDRLLITEDRVLVLTPEKLDLVLRFEPEALDNVALVALDEGQIVGDPGRGPRYELLVTRLKRRLPDARFLVLSAVVPHETLVDFAEWVRATEKDVVESAWRPSIQRVARLEWSAATGTGVLRYDPSAESEVLAQYLPNLVVRRSYEYRHPTTRRLRHEVFPEASNKGQIAAALAWELAEHGPVLIFCAQTNWAESTGTALEKRVELAALGSEPVPDVFRPTQLSRSYFVALEWLGPEDVTTRLLQIGVGIHHARQPEAVRLAIEEDFRRRRLAVLAATTTLAQGVNLPLRTVIFHSVWRHDEETDTQVKLPARDYWNIAGRAGRAGEETEGTIIHIVQNDGDRRDYEEYLRARDSLAPVESALYQLLRDLVASRISASELALKLDAELLALLVEEAAGELDQETLGSVINNSLAAVQASRHGQSTMPMIASLTEGANQIATRVPDADQRKVYGSTGLRSESCLAITEHIETHREQLASLFETGGYAQLGELTRLLLDGVSAVGEMQPRSAGVENVHELLMAWLDGRPVADDLATLGRGENVSRFIEEFFTYLLPWGITAYVRIAAHTLNVQSLPTVVTGVASLVKRGVPMLEAAWAMSAGIPDRQTAIILAKLYASTTSDTSPSGFRRWLGNIDPEDLAENQGIPEEALGLVSRAVYRTTQSTVLSRLDEGQPILPLSCRVRGLRRASAYIQLLSPGDILEVRRDYDSPYRNATYLDWQARNVGYLSPPDALAVAPEIDAGVAVVARIEAIESTDGGGSVLQATLHSRDELPLAM
jgi:helicase